MKKVYQIKGNIFNKKSNQQEQKIIFVLLTPADLETLRWFIEEYNLNINIEYAGSDY